MYLYTDLDMCRYQLTVFTRQIDTPEVGYSLSSSSPLFLNQRASIQLTQSPQSQQLLIRYGLHALSGACRKDLLMMTKGFRN